MGRTKHTADDNATGWATKLAALDEGDHLACAVGLCERLGLFVGKEARAELAAHPTIAIGDCGKGLLGLPNKVVASVARNYGFEPSDDRLVVVEAWAGDIELDEASVRVICKAAAAGDCDYMLALLYRFSRNAAA